MHWHARYFQQEKDYLLKGASLVMLEAGFHDPTIGESEVIAWRDDVTAFIGVVWQRDGPGEEPPFWVVITVAAGGDTAKAIADLEERWGKHWFLPPQLDPDKYT